MTIGETMYETPSTTWPASLKDLVGNFKRLVQGGVARMVELQQQGFAHLRP